MSYFGIYRLSKFEPRKFQKKQEFVLVITYMTAQFITRLKHAGKILAPLGNSTSVGSEYAVSFRFL